MSPEDIVYHTSEVIKIIKDEYKHTDPDDVRFLLVKDLITNINYKNIDELNKLLNYTNIFEDEIINLELLFNNLTL